jgi:hypothetical protein
MCRTQRLSRLGEAMAASHELATEPSDGCECDGKSSALNRGAAGVEVRVARQLATALGMHCASASIMGRDPVHFISVPCLRPDAVPLRKAAMTDPLGASRLRGRPVSGGPPWRRHKGGAAPPAPDNRVVRLGAHRRALRDYIHSLDDPARSRCSTRCWRSTTRYSSSGWRRR